MPLIQIGLPRGRTQPVPVPKGAASSTDAAIRRQDLAPSTALALAGGLILLAPLARIPHNSLLLVGLLVTALIAALLRATHQANVS